MLSKETIELFNRYLAKDLSKDQLERFKKILETEQGRKEFARFMEETGVIIHSSKQIRSLEIENSAITELVKRSEENLLAQLGEKNLQAAKSAPVKKTAVDSSYVRTRPLSYLYLAVLGLAATVILFFLLPKKNKAPLITSEAELVKSVARVTHFEGKGNIANGEWLKPGEVILEEGGVEITFDSGAVILLQGKSSLKLENEKRAFLKFGKVAARVPEEAIGFIINTPQGTVVDLGTEFAVAVDENKAMEVHVIDGEVEAGSLTGNEPKLLRKDESLRIENGGSFSEVTVLDKTHFSRVKENTSDIAYNFVHWPFDQVEDKTVFDQGNGGFGARFDLYLPNPDENIKTGKVGRALSLSGKGEYAQSSFPGIGAANARTVAFWVKIPPNSKQKEAYSIVSWGKVAPSQKWQVGYNPNPSNGVVGAIRTEFSKGYVIGTTDLRDGRWHHVVSMFIGGEKPDVATHVRHYIDGKLEGVSGFQPRKINTNISDPDTQPVYLGKYINHDNWYFRGKIDEFYIFDGALTPHQISLLRTNTFVQP